jgi:hypothetical protein
MCTYGSRLAWNHEPHFRLRQPLNAPLLPASARQRCAHSQREQRRARSRLGGLARAGELEKGAGEGLFASIGEPSVSKIP